MQRFVNLYFITASPERVQEVRQAHIGYWRALSLEGYQGGPFGDRGGGLITFLARDLETAERLAAEDPFVTEGILGERWVREWVVVTGSLAG